MILEQDVGSAALTAVIAVMSLKRVDQQLLVSCIQKEVKLQFVEKIAP